MISQLPLLRKACDDLGFCTLDKVGFEADDLMGALATIASDQQIKSKIITGDKDTFQLVNDTVSVLMNQKGKMDLVEYTTTLVLVKIVTLI